MAKIERIHCGNGNCFLIQENNNAILVDTSRIKFRDKIFNACKDKNVKLIVLTHGHVDHIQNAAYLSEQLNAPIVMHRADFDLSKDNMIEPLFAHSILGKLVLALSINSFQHDTIEPFTPVEFVQEGDTLKKYGINAVIVELPGHTKGSIGVLVNNTDFIVGDALMNMFYPSKSMLYGNRMVMEASAAKISNSNAKTIHFGHGNSTANKAW